MLKGPSTHDHALREAEGGLPHQGDAPAQQHGAQHRPVYVLLGENIQDHVQEDPPQHQRQQVPHGPAGEKLLPEVGGGVGQAQHKAARDLVGLVDGVVPAAEGFIVDDQMPQCGGKGRIKVRLEQGLALLADALADAALAEAVAAGNVESRHQRFAVGKEEKGHGGDSRYITHRVKLRGVGKHDQQHADAFEQIEHSQRAGGAGFGLHGQGSSFAPQIAPDGKRPPAWRKMIKKYSLLWGFYW